jgi:hypothetical protein
VKKTRAAGTVRVLTMGLGYGVACRKDIDGIVRIRQRGMEDLR